MNVTAVQVVEQDANQDKKAKRGGEAVELQKKKKTHENLRDVSWFPEAEGR